MINIILHSLSFNLKFLKLAKNHIQKPLVSDHLHSLCFTHICKDPNESIGRKIKAVDRL